MEGKKLIVNGGKFLSAFLYRRNGIGKSKNVVFISQQCLFVRKSWPLVL